MTSDVSKPYYQKTRGLRFECTRCGHCCTRPGPVYFPEPELERAAAHLGLTPRGFRSRYAVRRIDGVPALDPGNDLPCPFYDETDGCTIYDARPTQCRTFPFWPEIVNRKRDWDREARECEGMNRGPRHAVARIEQAVLACEAADLPEGD